MSEQTPLPPRTGAKRPNNGSILGHQTEAAAEPGRKQGRPPRVEVTERAPSGKPSYAGRSMTVYFGSADDKDLVLTLAKYATAIGKAGSTQEWITGVLVQAAEQLAAAAGGGIYDQRLQQREQDRARRRAE